VEGSGLLRQESTASFLSAAGGKVGLVPALVQRRRPFTNQPVRRSRMASKKPGNTKKSEDPGHRMPPEQQRPTGTLPDERRRPAAEQRTTQSRRDNSKPYEHR
jgi:hypothetical protein